MGPKRSHRIPQPSSTRVSSMSPIQPGSRWLTRSVIFLGKGVASLCFEPTVERLGFKWTLYILCGVQCLGAISEHHVG
jgi:hypothetical protein